jgi:hypothetical protein
MLRSQLLIVPALIILALASSAQAEVIINSGTVGDSEVQTSNLRVGDGIVSIRRNSRIRKKNRYGQATKVAPRVYYPVVNPSRDDDGDYSQTTTNSSSSSTVNGRTHSNTQTTTVRGNSRTIIQSNTRD